MIQNVVCDRCKKPILPGDAERMGLAEGMQFVHIPGYDGDYAERFAYIDLCPDCAKKFHEWMEANEE